MKLIICLLTFFVVFDSGCSKNSGLREAGTVLITSIAPSSGPAGTTVIIKGAHFGVYPSDNIVRFNNDSAAVFTSSDDSLVVVAPANGTTGPVSVTVAGSTATGPVFTYTADSVDVYVSAPSSGVVYWKNGQQVYLAPTQSNIGGAYGIALSDNNVYVGGYTYSNTYPNFEAAYWKNGIKTKLSSPDYAGQVRAFVLSGYNIYAGGSEDQLPCYWKNGFKYGLQTSGSGYARVNSIAINGSDVYAAGFEAGPNNEQRLVYWKNGVETVLGKNGLIDIGATSITTNGSDVYVCATDSGAAVYWKNGVRTVLEKFPGDAPVEANAIAIVNNSIYVMGRYRGDAVYWKDGVKKILPKQRYNASASAITFYQSDIYIGGIDGDTPVYWKNGVEVPLCCSTYGSVSGIVVVKK